MNWYVHLSSSTMKKSYCEVALILNENFSTLCRNNGFTVLNNWSTEIYGTVVALKADLRVAYIKFFVNLVLTVNGNMMPLKLKFDEPSKKVFDNFVTIWRQRLSFQSY